MFDYLSALPNGTAGASSGTWWQTAIGAGTGVLNTVLDYNLKSKALERGVYTQTATSTTAATTTGLPGQPPQANLGLTTSGLAGYNWGSIIVLLIVVALGWALLRNFLR